MEQEQQETVISEDWFEGDPIREQPSWKKMFKALFALALLVSFVGFSGLYQLTFYGTTPDDFERAEIVSVVPGEVEHEVVLSAYIITDEPFTSERSIDSVEQAVRNASRIWSQGNITLTLAQTQILTGLDLQILTDARNGIPSLMSTLPNHNPEQIAVFFVRELGGINGIAYPGLSVIAVADKTTVPDFRVLAHEVGHILSLKHVDDPRLLMSRGSSSYSLTPNEVLQARNYFLQ